MLNLLGNVAEMHVVPRPCGTFHLERISIEHVEPQKGLNKQEVDTQPDGSAPVAVSSEQSTVGISWYIANSECLAIDVHGIWVLLMVLGHRPDTVLGQELGFVQHPLENLLQAILTHQ